MTTTFSSKAAQFAALVAPFPAEAVEQRSQGGETFFYYPVDLLRQRLNEVFPASYDFHVNKVITTEGNVDMSCILTLYWVDGTKNSVEEWGSSDILRSERNNRRVNDPTKTASSDALKRCLAFFGCGGELYNKEFRESLKKQAEALPPRKERNFGSKPAPAQA